MILEHLDKNNLYHAYLIEGTQKEILPEILEFMKILKIKTSGNPDFYHINVDSFKIDDARNLKSLEYQKSFLDKEKKIFLISANNFLLEAQNTLLKIFEEPIENTHFFILVPNVDILLKTFVSRFYLIRTKAGLENEMKEAEKFIMMSIKNRIDFIKKLIIKSDDDLVIGLNLLDSPRIKSLKFLNALEIILHNKFLQEKSNGSYFQQIFKVREFINQPGSSLKSLMESIALVIPIL